MGIVATGGACGQMLLDFGKNPDGSGLGYRMVGLPCNPAFPLIVVTPTPGGDQNAYASRIFHSSSLPAAAQVAAIASSPIITTNGTVHERKLMGVHEMGHIMGLGDCSKPNDPKNVCNLTETQTVMWWESKPDIPVVPTFCDIEWANFYEYIM